MTERTQPTIVNDDDTSVSGRLDAIEQALTANTEILSDLADTVLKMSADTRLDRFTDQVAQLADALMNLCRAAQTEVNAQRSTQK